MKRRLPTRFGLAAAGCGLLLAAFFTKAGAQPATPTKPAATAAPDDKPSTVDAKALEMATAGRIGDLTPEAGERGWDLFFSKGCIKCHSVWGRGGTIAPDLGRSRVNRLSEGALAAELWKHSPRMWAKMVEQKITFQPISSGEMGDLFAFLFFLRYMDEPGDAQLGRLAMLRHRCEACHQVGEQGGSVGPDLNAWSKYTNPVVWSQMMWRAAPVMRKAMEEKNMTWPVFGPDDMVNMIAYVRSVAPSRDKVYLTVGVPAKGAELVQSKQCLKCHGEGGDAPRVTDLEIPPNPAQAAVTMLNHAPKMLERMKAMKVDVPKIEPQEMAHILAYLLSLSYVDRPGDAVKGAALYKQRGCDVCHEHGVASAPMLAGLHPEATVSFVTHQMWNNGGKMLDAMTARGTNWPEFSRTELLDLIAFLGKTK